MRRGPSVAWRDRLLRILYASIPVLLTCAPALATTTDFVEFQSAMTHLANVSDPGIGMSWTATDFDDSAWTAGTYGVGYDDLSAAQDLLETTVPNTSLSVYTRAVFNIADVSQIDDLFLGCDFDDGYVAWINGVEVFRSATMPAGGLDWNTPSQPHESSNAFAPQYEIQNISAAGIPALQNGRNVLAIGVWNVGTPSTDLVLVPWLFSAEQPTLTRGPYLQSGTDDSVVVRWRTDFPTATVVDYGAQPGSLTNMVQDLTATTEHEITLPNLSANTTYYYAVGDGSVTLAGDDPDHFFVTAPPPGTFRPTRIWVLGDSGTGDSNAEGVRDAYHQFTAVHTDLWLMLGDNAYPDGTDAEYQTALFDVYPDMLRKSVLWPTLGNHDGHTADSQTQSGPYYDIFTLPTDGGATGYASGTEAYYSFDFGNVHFVVLDSYETDRSVGGAMLDWLAMDLANSTQDWIIAYWHHPPYSKGSHDSDTEVELIDMRENAVPILEDHGVDLVLAGHSHAYERSRFIDGVHDTPTPGYTTLLSAGDILDTGDGRLDGDGAYRKPVAGPRAGRGTAYAVCGSSGQLSTEGSRDHSVMYVSLLEFGSLVLDLEANRLHVSFLNEMGTVQDHFTLSKQGCLHEPAQDSDTDGVCDGIDNCTDDPNTGQADDDGDGVGNVCDVCPADPDPLQTDGDGDGVGDVCDICPDDPDNPDADADGVCDDVDNCPVDANPDQEDADGDGQGNECDACPFDPDDDIDGDTVCGDEDNCPAQANPGQEDADGDGQGNVCDACPFDPDDDIDGDGVCSDEDNCPLFPNPGQTDSDQDGPGDACDPCPLDPLNDADGDSVCAGSDSCPAVANPDQTDSDGDGPGDVCDPCPLDADNDVDRDGLCANADNCPGTFNPAQTDTDQDGFGDACDSPEDSDGDGIPDQIDNCIMTANPTQLDTDADSLGDACDLDDDNDSVIDAADCARVFRGVSAIPGPIGGTLHVDKASGGTLYWSRGEQGHTSNVYRGFVGPSEPFSYNLVCHVAETAELEAEDSEDPLPGGMFTYVVSGKNTCGESDLGKHSSGDDRPASIVCPTVGGESDGDGIVDLADNCPLIPNPTLPDFDADFVGSHCDNCVTVPNPQQEDTDGDGTGDACVGLVDTDGDGIEDALDNCPDDPNLGQTDGDADSLGDVCDDCPADADNDLDGDDVCGDIDNCPEAANPTQVDADGDGLGNPCDPAAPLAGSVFEDVQYGGGAGRDAGVAGAVGRPNARVELYDQNGDFVSSVVTDVAGGYSFEVPHGATYTVRAVNVTVTSSRGGAGLLAVPTYRTDAGGGTVVPVTDHVGGEVPHKVDAGNGSTTLAALDSAMTTAQSIAQAAVDFAGLANVDFGFNFNTIVNTNEAGQGSLRQLVLNANALPNTGLAQEGRPAGIDNVIFMLADGTGRPGLTAGYASQFVGGVATINPASGLPLVTDPLVVDATLQPGYAGVPMIELNGIGAGTGISGLFITAGGSTVRGMVIHTFDDAAIFLQSSGGNTVQANYIGTDPTGTVAKPNVFEGIAIQASNGNVIGGTTGSDRNVISGNRQRGVLIFGGSTGNVVRGNYIGTDASGTIAVPNEIGVYLFHSPDNTIGGTAAGAGNVISGNEIFGVYLFGNGTVGTLVQGNVMGFDASLTSPLGNGRMGIDINNGVGNTIGGSAAGAGNLIAGNGEIGVRVFQGRRNTIRSNTIFANVGPGIHHGLGTAVNPNDGQVGTGPNDGMDYPVLTTATVDAGSLHVEGYVGTLTQPVAGVHLIDVFKADNAPADQNGEIEVGDGLSVPHGEGRSPIGTCSSLADGSFVCDVPIPGSVSLGPGDPVTATATDGAGNTSEFGPNAAAVAPAR